MRDTLNLHLSGWFGDMAATVCFFTHVSSLDMMPGAQDEVKKRPLYTCVVCLLYLYC